MIAGPPEKGVEVLLFGEGAQPAADPVISLQPEPQNPASRGETQMPGALAKTPPSSPIPIMATGGFIYYFLFF